MEYTTLVNGYQKLKCNEFKRLSPAPCNSTGRLPSLAPTLLPSGPLTSKLALPLIKPRLLESGVVPESFARLGEGFKRVFIGNDAQKLRVKKPVVIATSGYTGHRKGERSENLFGKCFREVSLNSKAIERGALVRHRSLDHSS